VPFGTLTTRVIGHEVSSLQVIFGSPSRFAFILATEFLFMVTILQLKGDFLKK